MSLNGYLFAASVIQTQVLPANLGHGLTGEVEQVWGDTPSVIVCAENEDSARRRFEKCLCAQPEGQNPLTTKIHKIVGSPLVGQLLRETEPERLDWPAIVRQSEVDVELTPAGDLGQGCWLDLADMRPSPNLAALRQDLPAETSAGLNWATDRQYFFVISVLRPPPPPSEFPDGPLPARPENGWDSDDETGGSESEPGEAASDFPPVADLAAAALIRARNAAVAVWLWRRYAAGVKLAGNEIRVDAWCGIIGYEEAEDQPAG